LGLAGAAGDRQLVDQCVWLLVLKRFNKGSRWQRTMHHYSTIQGAVVPPDLVYSADRSKKSLVTRFSSEKSFETSREDKMSRAFSMLID
jgi:hypothetical protein